MFKGKLSLMSYIMIIGLILVSVCNLFIYWSQTNLIFFIGSIIYFIVMIYIENFILIKHSDLNKKIFIIAHQGAYLFSVSEFMEYSSRDVSKSVLMFLMSLLVFNIIIMIIGFSFKKHLMDKSLAEKK